jgi:DNA-binding protein H-NS
MLAAPKRGDLPSHQATEQRRTLESELAKLTRFQGGARSKGAFGSGVRGKVAAKYGNPDNPAETWAGRGLGPRWLAAAIRFGKKIDDFLIAGGHHQKQTAGRRRVKPGSNLGCARSDSLKQRFLDPAVVRRRLATVKPIFDSAIS